MFFGNYREDKAKRDPIDEQFAQRALPHSIEFRMILEGINLVEEDSSYRQNQKKASLPNSLIFLYNAKLIQKQ